MTKTYKTCPGPGWYWCRTTNGVDRLLREFRSDDGMVSDGNDITGLKWSEYTDFEPVSIVPREVEEKMTRGERVVAKSHISPILSESEAADLAAVIDEAIADERDTVKALHYWMERHAEAQVKIHSLERSLAAVVEAAKADA